MKVFRRILHATDFSRASGPAFSRAVGLARASGAELLIAHVLPSVGPLGAEGYVAPRMYVEMEAAVRRGAEKRLNSLLERARKARVRPRGLLLEGVAHEKIASTAKARKVDLVVVGTQGRTGLARMLLGSVAARVIATSPCPVLAVRGR
jgi:nucleotide-binding universal stress UspA family protein